MSDNNNKSLNILTVGAAIIGLSSATAALYLRNNRKKEEARISSNRAGGGGGSRKSATMLTTTIKLTNEVDKEPPDPPRSQEEVYQHFAPLLEKEGTIHTKNVTSYVRQAIQGEKVTTTIDGKQETQYEVKDENSWLVCGKAAGEYYILTDVQLQANYDTENAKEISQEDDYILAKRLRQQGFLEYKSTRKVYARRVTKQDMDYFCHGNPVPKIGGTQFVAPWGELVYVEEGDYLVTQYHDPNDNNTSNNTEKEIYRIQCHVFHYNYVDDKNPMKIEGSNNNKGGILFPVVGANATIGVTVAAGAGAVVLMMGIILKRTL